MMKRISAALKNGIINQNPSFVLLLGMCPLLAISTTVQNGIGMGIAATFVLICSNVVISMLRKFIPNEIRIAAYVVVIAGFVSIVDLLLKAYIPSLAASLGIFIPLIVVNCIILARTEAFASKNGIFDSLLDGFSIGMGFTLALTLISAIREILGNGTFFGFHILGKNFPAALFMVLPVGGFLTLGFIIAAIQKLNSNKKEGK